MSYEGLRNALDQKLFGKWIPLNDEYFAIRERPGILSINTDEYKESAPSFDKMVPAFFDAAKKIAAMLQEDPTYADIEKITATSWFATMNPRALQLAGFHIDDRNEDPVGTYLKRKYKVERATGLYRLHPEYRDIEPTYSYMTREEFLARYGSAGESVRPPGLEPGTLEV